MEIFGQVWCGVQGTQEVCTLRRQERIKLLSFSSPQHPQSGVDQDAATVRTRIFLSPKKAPSHCQTFIASVGGMHLSALLLLLSLLHDLLDNLLLLDQESAGDAVLDAVGAARAAVGARDGLLRAGDGCVLAGTESGDLWCVLEVMSRVFVGSEGDVRRRA